MVAQSHDGGNGYEDRHFSLFSFSVSVYRGIGGRLYIYVIRNVLPRVFERKNEYVFIGENKIGRQIITVKIEHTNPVSEYSFLWTKEGRLAVTTQRTRIFLGGCSSVVARASLSMQVAFKEYIEYVNKKDWVNEGGGHSRFFVTKK